VVVVGDHTRRIDHGISIDIGRHALELITYVPSGVDLP
jgi:hypothetical protein